MDAQAAQAFREQVEQFMRRFRTGLVTMLFTDLVGSAKLKQTLGDREGVALMQHHHAVVRELLGQFDQAVEMSTAGDSFFLLFVKPSDAVRFGLQLQARNRAFSESRQHPLEDRIGIHLGEVAIEQAEGANQPRQLYGAQVDLAARVMALGGGNQILLTRAAFDNARQVLKGEDMPGLAELSWLNHGPYLMAGFDEPIEICEVGERGKGRLSAPEDTPKAKHHISPDSEPVLGWRPALEQMVPNTRWVLEEKLGEGGFGEVWLARHQTLKERRVFKFCFRADRVRSLKREVTLFRLLKERVGEHPHIAQVHDVFFDQPPFYIEVDYVQGSDLRTWCQQQGGVERVPLETRLEIVAQVGEALQAAHEAGIIHRDVKPTNILVSGGWRVTGDEKELPPDSSAVTRHSSLAVKLTDFGIGQVVSAECLAGITRAGFTQTLLGSPGSSGTGTPIYMAPELLAGKAASIRSDIYSLGVVLYQLVVGDPTRPLTTDWAEQIADPLLREDLRHCFAGNPQDRFASAAQLVTQLRSLPSRREALARQEAELAARERAAYRRGVLRTAGAATLIIILLAGSALYAARQAREARRAAGRANTEAARANAKELEARRILYAADMNLAQNALRMNNVGRARALLDRHRPGPGDSDLRGWEWRYLWQRCQSDALGVLTKNSNRVFSVSFSADGRLLAVGYLEGPAQVWDVGPRRLLATLETFRAPAAVAFSPRTNLLAATALLGTVNLWEPLSKTQVARFWHGGLVVRSIAFSPDGRLLAVFGLDKRLTIWSVETGEALRAIPLQAEGSVFHGLAVFSPDGLWLAIGESDGAVRVLETATWNERARIKPHQEGITALAFSKDAKFLVSGSGFAESSARVWNLEKGVVAATLAGHTAFVWGLAFSADGQILASASADQTIRLWDAATWKELATLRGHGDEVEAVAFSPDGRTLASGCKDGSVLLWDAKRRQTTAAHFSLPEGLRQVWLTADGKTVLALDATNRLSRWDIATGEETQLFGLEKAEPYYAADGKLFLLRSEPAALEAWDVRVLPPKRLLSESVLPGASSLLYEAERNLVALGNRSGAICLLKLGRTNGATRLVGHATNAWPVKFVDHGRRLLTQDAQQVTKCWDLEHERELFAFTIPWGLMHKRLCSNGRFFAGASPNQVLVWDLEDPVKAPLRIAHKGGVTDIAFSPDSRLLASATQLGEVRVWALPGGQQKLYLKGHLLAVHCLAFSPSGTRLATGSNGSEAIKLWDLTTGQEAATLEAEGSVFSELEFSEDGSALLAGGTVEGTCHVWRAPSFAEIAAAESRLAAPSPGSADSTTRR